MGHESSTAQQNRRVANSASEIALLFTVGKREYLSTTVNAACGILCFASQARDASALSGGRPVTMAISKP
jgi:hypothetical protein